MNKIQVENKVDFHQVKKTCDAIRSEVAKIVVGYGEVVDDFLVCLIAQGHMFMLGVPGIAKTTLAKTFATVTGLSWNRVQFTQDLLPSDIVGHMFYDQKDNDFKLRKGPIFSELVLADEINRAPPKTQSALIEAMQEHQVTIEGNTLPLPQSFLVIATKNPVETEGVYPLPEAQLDRFLYRVTMDYLPKEKEFELLKMLRTDTIKGHWSCPCGSGKELRRCHVEAIRALHEKLPKTLIERSYCILNEAAAKGPEHSH